MALFKILKGESSRIDTGTTKFNEGYAYFTPDDAGFYIDATVGERQKRIRINRREIVASRQPDKLDEGDTWLQEVV